MAIIGEAYSDSGSITLDDLVSMSTDFGWSDTTASGIRRFKRLVNTAIAEARNAARWSFLRKKGRITTTAEYDTGTVAVTNGSTAVTGTDTVWTSSMAGSYLVKDDDSEDYKIASVTDGTHIVLDTAYRGTTSSGSDYTIIKRGYDVPSDFEAFSSDIKDVSSGRWLTCIRGWSDYLTARHDYSPTGTPSYYFLDEDNKQVIILPGPTDAVVLDFVYLQMHPEYTDGSEVIDWPYSLVHILHLFIKMLVHEDAKDPAKSSYFRQRAQEAVKRARSQQSPSRVPQTRRARSFQEPSLNYDEIENPEI